MKQLIYTVITGDYDNVSKCPTYPNWEYLLITDNPNINANGWTLKVVPKQENSVKLQRYWKINSHLLGYDLTVYIDGNMELKYDPLPILTKYFDKDILLVTHPVRKCITDESEAIIKTKKDSFETVRNQIGSYIQHGIPFDYGMFASGFIARNNNVKDLEVLWWDEVKKHSHRDQLSLPYALWKTDTRIAQIPWSTLNHYVTIKEHKKREPITIWYSNPYSVDKNFGKAINDFCKIVPNEDDWIVIQDGDICYLTPDWGRIINDSLQAHGNKFGLIGCYTNCLNGLHQLHENKRVIDLGMKEHHLIADKYNSIEIEELPNTGVAGFFMAFKKSTWIKVGGFVENNKAFDTIFNNAVRQHKMKIGIMKGLYVYHLYRIWDDGNPASIKHLE